MEGMDAPVNSPDGKTPKAGVKGGKKKGGADEAMLDSDSDEDSDEDEVDKAEDGNLKLGGGAKEIKGYGEEDEDSIFGDKSDDSDADMIVEDKDDDDDDKTDDEGSPEEKEETGKGKGNNKGKDKDKDKDKNKDTGKNKGVTFSQTPPSLKNTAKKTPGTLDRKSANAGFITDNVTFCEDEGWVEVILSFPASSRR